MALKTYDTIDPQGEFPATNPSKTISNQVINQKTGGTIRFWFGTAAEYNAISVKEDDVIYHIIEE